jgi:hypothetical protein
MDIPTVIKRLNLDAINAGCCAGGEWRADPDTHLIESENPSTAQVLAHLRGARPVPMRGRRTCGVRRIRSTGEPPCRWPRG